LVPANITMLTNHIYFEGCKQD